MESKLLENQQKSRAIRDFDTEKKISNEKWQDLLEIARLAPSSNGLEPWKIIQIDSEKLREKLSTFSPGMTKQLLTADKFIFFTALKFDENYFKHLQEDVHGYDDILFKKWQKNFKRLHNEFLQIDESAWLERQVMLSVGQMVFAAGQLEVDSCIMEGFNTKEITSILEKEGVLNSEKERLTVAVAFGYRKNTPKRPKTRKKLSELLKII
ncbi:NAD(P)H-dependent oxidoreductase [Lactococcus nasutitermitis]|uniref:NAD(P)H-dependent oxidoreductase n=1 Tax=Lactococcus nasutitermitis TaxID=1652957 RepID=A0ABV9JFI1_9LACT|nr:NAD(P)H-dependent oxidoreductase [Lactococcus nasutitermitis]